MIIHLVYNVNSKHEIIIKRRYFSITNCTQLNWLITWAYLYNHVIVISCRISNVFGTKLQKHKYGGTKRQFNVKTTELMLYYKTVLYQGLESGYEFDCVIALKSC